MSATDGAASGQLVFSSGDLWYGVPADAVQEVVLYGDLTRVPGAPPHVLGVFSLRGEVFPVIDVSQLHGRGKHGDAARRAIILRLSKGVLAFTTDKLGGVSSVEGELEPAGAAGAKRFFRGPGRA